MTTIPKSWSATITYDYASPEAGTIQYTQESNCSFDRLFAVLFNSMKLQELVGNTELSNMLNSIAHISNNLNK